MSSPKEKASAKDDDVAAGLRIDRCSAAGAGMGGRQRPRAFAPYGLLLRTELEPIEG